MWYNYFCCVFNTFWENSVLLNLFIKSHDFPWDHSWPLLLQGLRARFTQTSSGNGEPTMKLIIENETNIFQKFHLTSGEGTCGVTRRTHKGRDEYRYLKSIRYVSSIHSFDTRFVLSILICSKYQDNQIPALMTGPPEAHYFNIRPNLARFWSSVK